MPEPIENLVAGHERRDVEVGRLVLFGVGISLTVALSLIAMWLLFGYFASHQPPGSPASPLAGAREIPPAPRLQLTPQADLAQKRRAEDAVLYSYGWIDRSAGIVRIPVDRAIELLAQRGLPVRAPVRGPAAAPVSRPTAEEIR
ncbi:MAG: hypothetical protein AAB225_29685 [Acidobacteriota bacterium]